MNEDPEAQDIKKAEIIKQDHLSITMDKLARRRLDQGVKPGLDHLLKEASDVSESDFDNLTGTLKKEPFEERLSLLAQQLVESGEEATMAFIDVNGLKIENDTNGHLAGNELLKRIGKAILKAFRTSDLSGRIGGDEFIVILVGMNPQQAEEVIKNRFFPQLGKDTVSIGLTSLDPNNTEKSEKEADTAMYDSKGQSKQTPGNYVTAFKANQ